MELNDWQFCFICLHMFIEKGRYMAGVVSYKLARWPGWHQCRIIYLKFLRIWSGSLICHFWIQIERGFSWHYMPYKHVPYTQLPLESYHIISYDNTVCIWDLSATKVCHISIWQTSHYFLWLSMSDTQFSHTKLVIQAMTTVLSPLAYGKQLETAAYLSN